MLLVIEFERSLMSMVWVTELKTANLFLATNTAEVPDPRFVSVGSTGPDESFGRLISSYIPLSVADVTRIALSAGL